MPLVPEFSTGFLCDKSSTVFLSSFRAVLRLTPVPGCRSGYVASPQNLKELGKIYRPINHASAGVCIEIFGENGK
jgi:hypothetical protein